MAGMPIWLAVVLVVVGAAPGFYRYVLGPRMRTQAQRLRRRTKTTSVAALEEGKLARITGVVTAREELLTSPVGRHACIGYSLVISSKPSNNAGEVWDPIIQRQACGAFSLTDDTGTALVEGPFRIDLDPDDGAWANLPAPVYAILDEAKVSLTEFGRDRDFRFQEALLKVGDRINVFGRPALGVDSAGRGSFRDPPSLRHIRGTPDEPVILVDEEEPPLS